ncbi:MAG TPA: flagellar assembly protein FliW [Syntrophomonadaceae bacterium]|nr:flagellar assembly protein FliW [Syntrophomonadaceae bacterium]
MQIQTAVFGEISISEADVIHFPEGLPAFEEEKEFILIPLDEESPFFYLQSAQTPDVCLLTADPFIFFPSFQVELPEEILEQLEIDKEKPPLIVLTVLTVPEDFKKASANLMAPLIINIEKKIGLQFIPVKTDYKTKHPLFSQEKTVAGEGK